MSTATQKDINEMVLQHKYGGNAWVMVEDFDDDYCRIAGVSPNDVGDRAFVAWKKILSPQYAINDQLKVNVLAMREQLLTGAKVVRNSYIVKV